MTADSARKAGAAAICAFAATVVLTIAGANVSWGFLAAALLGVFAAGGEIRWRARSSALELPLIFYLAVSVLTSALGTNPAYSFRFTNQDVHKIWIYYLFTVGTATCPAVSWKRWIGAGFVAAAVVGIYQAAPTFFLDLPAEQKIRAHAFVHPVTYGSQIACALLGAVAILCGQERPSPTIRRLATTCIVLFSAALLFSGTRTAVLSAIGGAAAVFLIVPRLRKWVFLILPVAVLAIAALEVAIPGRALVGPLIRVARAGATNDPQLQRLRLWDGALSMAKDHPLTGVGHNNFRAEFPKYVRTVFDDGRESFGTAHNLFIHHLAERGVLGLGASLWLFGALLLRAWHRSKHKSTSTNLWAMGVSVAFLIQNMTEVALQVEILWLLVFFVWISAETEYKLGLESPESRDEQ